MGAGAVVDGAPEVWTGWAYWTAGDWWPEGEPLNIQPTKSGDRPQLQALLSGKTTPMLACVSLRKGK